MRNAAREGGRARVPIYKGVVRAVNGDHHTVDVELQGGAQLYSVPIVSAYANVESGQGEWWVPEVGASCLVIKETAEGAAPFVIGFYYEVSAETPADHSGGRGSAAPGTYTARSRENSFFRLLPGGIAEIGSGEGARTQYLKVVDLIRHISARYENLVSGSAFRTTTHPADEQNRHPLEVELLIQEFTENPPIVYVHAGRVLDDVDRRLADNAKGQIVGRLLVFDDQTVQLAQAAGIPPSPDQATVQIRGDKAGNFEEIFKGKQVTAANGRTVLLENNDALFVQGAQEQQITGAASKRVGGNYTLSSGRNMTIQAEGELTLACRHLRLLENGARTNELQGDRTEVTGGNRRDATAGDLTNQVGGSAGQSIVGDEVKTVGGKSHETVVHADPTGQLQNVVAKLLTVLDGSIQTQAVQGDIRLVVGPPGAELCTLKVHGDPRTPQERSRVSISFPNSQNVIIFDGLTGSVQIKNSVGEWVLDPSGRTYLGTPGSAPAGNVVTTLTHPFCFLTGAPIMGCANVTASGPALPGVSAPVVRPTPNVDLPDVPRP